MYKFVDLKTVTVSSKSRLTWGSLSKWFQMLPILACISLWTRGKLESERCLAYSQWSFTWVALSPVHPEACSLACWRAGIRRGSGGRSSCQWRDQNRRSRGWDTSTPASAAAAGSGRLADSRRDCTCTHCLQWRDDATYRNTLHSTPY